MTKTKRSISTEGHRKLVAFLSDPDRSQTALAKQLGVAQSSVSLWVQAKSRPEPHLREAIELLTGIPAADWDTPEERAVVDRVRAELGTDAVTIDPPPAPTRKPRTSTRTKLAPKPRTPRRALPSPLAPTGT